MCHGLGACHMWPSTRIHQTMAPTADTGVLRQQKRKEQTNGGRTRSVATEVRVGWGRQVKTLVSAVDNDKMSLDG